MELITPEKAEEYLATRPDFQRDIKSRSLEKYCADMVGGRWKRGSVLEVAETEKGSLLLNGQHRLLAVQKTGLPQWFEVVRVARTYAEACEYYGIADTGASRTLLDALKTRSDLPIAENQMRKLCEAVRIIASNFSSMQRPLSHIESVQIALEWQTEYQVLIDMVNSSRYHSKFQNAPFNAAGVYLLRHQQKKAIEFFELVCSGNGPNPNHPTRRLIDYYITSSIGNKGESGRMHRLLMIAACWNKFFKSENEAKRITLPENGKVSFLGTPLK